MKPETLLVDTDALVHLIALGCLDDALACLGFEKPDCRRLSAAPHMMRGHRLKQQFPNLESARAEAQIREIPALELRPNPALESSLNTLPGMDEGEILLLSSASQDPFSLLMTGDLRSLQSLGNAQQPLVIEARTALRHRLLYFPQVLLPLARRVGLGVLDKRWRESSLAHKSLSIIFGSSAPQQWEGFEAGLNFVIGKAIEALGENHLFAI